MTGITGASNEQICPFALSQFNIYSIDRTSHSQHIGVVSTMCTGTGSRHCEQDRRKGEQSYLNKFSGSIFSILTIVTSV
jgi:hypothetical protein